MRFLANENFPRPSILLLGNHELSVKAIAEDYFGITDKEVIQIAIEENRTILTHDSDYGELIFRYGYKPPAGVIFFRLEHFTPELPAKLIISLN